MSTIGSAAHAAADVVAMASARAARPAPVPAPRRVGAPAQEFKAFLGAHPAARTLARTLRKGDLLVIEGHNGITRLSGSAWTHVAICIDPGNPAAGLPPRFVEAEGNPTHHLGPGGAQTPATGVVETGFVDVVTRYLGDGTAAGSPGTRLRVLRPAADPIGGERIAVWARQQLGKPYDYTFGQLQASGGRTYCSRLAYDACVAAGVPLVPARLARRNALPAALGLLLRECGASDAVVDEAIRTAWARCEEAGGGDPQALGFGVADLMLDDYFPRIPKTRAILAGGERVRAAVRAVLHGLVLKALPGAGLNATSERLSDATVALAVAGAFEGADTYVRQPPRPTYAPGSYTGLTKAIYDAVGYPLALAQWVADSAAAQIRSRQIFAEHMTDLQAIAEKVARTLATPPDTVAGLVTPGDLADAAPPVVEVVLYPDGRNEAIS